MRSSVVSDESERGVNRNSGCSSSLTCPDKVGEDIQKGAVERLVEFLVLAVDHLRRIETPHDFVGALGLGDAAHFAAEGIYLLDIMDRKVDIMTDVAVLDAVGIDQRVVDVADMVVLFQQFVVLLAQQVAHPDQLFVTALQTAVLPEDDLAAASKQIC